VTRLSTCKWVKEDGGSFQDDINEREKTCNKEETSREKEATKKSDR